MKKFKMVHLDFGTESLFNEDTVPKWLLSDEYNWFYKEYILTLDVGGNIETDFQRIIRVE